MYNIWCIQPGYRLHDLESEITYLIISEDRGDFFCLRYKEKDRTYRPEYVTVEREGFYKMFHLLDGNNVDQTIASPHFKDINFYLTQSSVYIDDNIGTFKFYPTLKELINLFVKLNYIKNPVIVASDLLENKRVWVESTFLFEIKQY